MKALEQIFLTVLNMSAAACVVIAVVLLARLALRRAPKKWSYLLWSVVAFRLCCPVSFKSVFSVFRLKPLQGAAATAAETTVTQTSAITYIPQITAQGPAVTPVTPAAPTVSITPSATVTPGVVATPGAAEAVQSAPSLLTVLTWMMIWLWLAAMLVLIGYSIYSYVKMRRVVDDAVLVRDNIYETDRIRTPFILGLIRPRIYIPVGLQGEQLDYVLTHESYHLRRHDNFIKTFAFLLMAVHWFNPLVWVAFHLMSRDMEMSCDEAVLGRREGANKMYSTALLTFAAPSHFPAATPLCFGESSVKSRIRNALRWRRPRTWVTLLAVALCIAALAACATNPVTPKTEPETIGHREEQGESGETRRPENPVDIDYRIQITDLGNDTFRMQGDMELDLTIQLPESWAGKYTYETDKSGVGFYDKTARADAPEGSAWGQLFAIRCRRGMYPLNYHWGYHARVLAVAGSYTVLMEYPDEIQSAEMAKSDEETTMAYLEMRRDTDQTAITLADGFAQRTYFNEAKWVDGTVTIYQNFINDSDGSLFQIPVFCDPETSAALRQIFDGRSYGSSANLPGRISTYTVVTDEATYDIFDLHEGPIIRDQSPDLAAEELLTGEEADAISAAIQYNGHTWQVKVTDLGNDTFRVEDAGFTRGLDVTVKLPSSWAGRYVARSSADGIDFYCKSTYEMSYDEGYRGKLCGVWVMNQVLSPDEPLWGDSRVLAFAGNYSVVLSCPGDVQFTESTADEYRAMEADKDQMEITLSDWMLANTWTEADRAADTVTLTTFGLDGGHAVICDAAASAAIRQMLESRTYEEHEDWWRDLVGSSMEISVNNTVYTLHVPQGSNPQECYIYRNDGRFATEVLTMEEVEWLHSVMDNNGVLPAVTYELDGNRYVIHGYEAARLDWMPGEDLYFANPAFWGQKFSGIGVEGSALWANAGKTELRMTFTVSNGRSSTGAMEGLHVDCTVDIGAGTLVSREITSDGGDTVELTDQELVEIAAKMAQILRDAEADAQRLAAAPAEPSEALMAAQAYFDELAESKMLNDRKVAYLKYIVEEDAYQTERGRANGLLGKNEIAARLTTIFVPENEDDLIYFAAGNLGEYTGDDPTVPEGAWVKYNVGYVTQEADGWHIDDFTNTGW
ncbi:MAG: M56 family metallopeptidase [Oscillospiraceae bacterium]|nr:M56 family metallopeptidase [Oscillospiraceae bacterium]